MMRDVPIALIGSLRVPHSFIDGTYAGYAASCRNGEIKKIPPPRSVIHA
ncbi:hypothetical protein ALC60_10467 [Trachymyrmex zeteki]|uniref:Uncharacterized protein n=1 Tax=Mycetomoellerius zeteki TaxID=64791 RepID=A0A151WRH9_9HYME|nr:hypothetical protein ALC60_10467 [Trachymyrmex zeteki]